MKYVFIIFCISLGIFALNERNVEDNIISDNKDKVVSENKIINTVAFDNKKIKKDVSKVVIPKTEMNYYDDKMEEIKKIHLLNSGFYEDLGEFLILSMKNSPDKNNADLLSLYLLHLDKIKNKEDREESSVDIDHFVNKVHQVNDRELEIIFNGTLGEECKTLECRKHRHMMDNLLSYLDNSLSREEVNIISKLLHHKRNYLYRLQEKHYVGENCKIAKDKLEMEFLGANYSNLYLVNKRLVHTKRLCGDNIINQSLGKYIKVGENVYLSKLFHMTDLNNEIWGRYGYELYVENYSRNGMECKYKVLLDRDNKKVLDNDDCQVKVSFLGLKSN